MPVQEKQRILNRRQRVEDIAFFEYYQQPKQLYTGRYGDELNNNDRTVYMLLYNRFLLSVKVKCIK